MGHFWDTLKVMLRQEIQGMLNSRVISSSHKSMNSLSMTRGKITKMSNQSFILSLITSNCKALSLTGIVGTVFQHVHKRMIVTG